MRESEGGEGAGAEWIPLVAVHLLSLCSGAVLVYHARTDPEPLPPGVEPGSGAEAELAWRVRLRRYVFQGAGLSLMLLSSAWLYAAYLASQSAPAEQIAGVVVLADAAYLYARVAGLVLLAAGTVLVHSREKLGGVSVALACVAALHVTGMSVFYDDRSLELLVQVPALLSLVAMAIRGHSRWLAGCAASACLAFVLAGLFGDPESPALFSAVAVAPDARIRVHWQVLAASCASFCAAHAVAPTLTGLGYDAGAHVVDGDVIDTGDAASQARPSGRRKAD